jgi:hypothetical protein
VSLWPGTCSRKVKTSAGRVDSAEKFYDHSICELVYHFVLSLRAQFLFA